jgi:hypothetical protein
MLMVASTASRDGLKGRPPPRRRPDDFEVIFVEQGRIGCEAWYRARRTTIDRWLDECGKDKLIKARAAYVAHQRAAGQWITRSTRLIENRPTGRTPRLQAIRDRRLINPTVARHAAQFLRIMRHGGFIISQAQNGDWWVGSKRLSAAQMVDLARSKGFDVHLANLQAMRDGEVES